MMIRRARCPNLGICGDADVLALRILVTKKSCGEIFYLSQERNVYLDYEGEPLGTVLETCEIKIKNSSPDEMICIKSGTNSSELMKTADIVDMDCIRVLKYYVGLHKYPHYTCHDFNRQPRCDRATEASAVFQSFLIGGSSVRVNLHIYVGKYSSATTTTRYTTNYWSSWSSCSSNSDYNKSSSRLGIGAVVGIVVGVISVFVICLLCILCCNAGAKEADPRAMQYQAATAGLNYPQQSGEASGTSLLSQGNQQYTSNPSSQPLINTPAMSNQYPGYQIDPPVYQSASPCSPETGTYPHQMSNTHIIPSAPPPPEDDIPDFPPPAYPGY